MVEKKATLKDVFNQFTTNKPDMDGKTFAKVAKDCLCLDKKLTATDVDLIFAKVKTSSAVRSITYEQFAKGVDQWAEKKGVAPADLQQAIIAKGGPQFVGTQGASKFHDDKSTYTGMHVGKDDNKPEESKGTGTKPAAEKKPQVVSSGTAAASLNEVFKNFSAGAQDIDGKTFAKFAKDTGILDKKVTATDIDLIFAKVKDKAARKITYAQFEQAVAQMAVKKGCTTEALHEKICATGGPAFSGTKTDAVKFYDDKSLFTGVHQHGGPSTSGDGGIKDISQLCDRTDADVRGVKK